MCLILMLFFWGGGKEWGKLQKNFFFFKENIIFHFSVPSFKIWILKHARKKFVIISFTSLAGEKIKIFRLNYYDVKIDFNHVKKDSRFDFLHF